MENHPFTENLCLWILLADGQSFDGKLFDTIPEQAFSQHLSSFFGGNEYHFKSYKFYSHKSHWRTILSFCNYDVGGECSLRTEI